MRYPIDMTNLNIVMRSRKPLNISMYKVRPLIPPAELVLLTIKIVKVIATRQFQNKNLLTCLYFLILFCSCRKARAVFVFYSPLVPQEKSSILQKA